MNLINLLEHVKFKNKNEARDIADRNVTGLAYNSSEVRPGTCFVAIKGGHFDGHDFIEDAVKKGASVIVSEKKVNLPEGVENIVVEDSRDALARLSARFFGDPSLGIKLVGITGTNGKTTITYILESIWKTLGEKTGVIGTVNYRYGKVLEIPLHTTPESYELQKLLRSMSDAGVENVVMEVSSHALDQRRVVECHFDGAIFTNLTQDHLDYHGDMRTYGAAKIKLFRERLPVSGKHKVWAVVNWDDPLSREIAKDAGYPVYRYSVKDRVEVYASNYDCDLKRTAIEIVTPGGSFKVTSNLKGIFNVSNILASVATCYALGISLENIRRGIEAVRVIPGRMEEVANECGLFIFVDYAHTGDALQNVLTALRSLSPRRLITVFGCGGDRDRAKRPLMGEVVARQSDVAIVTSDNPRSEPPGSIIAEILPGVHRARMEPYNQVKGYLVVEDRREAIAKALSIASSGDVVLIAGKGHEIYQIIGKTRCPFSDREVVMDILGNLR